MCCKMFCFFEARRKCHAFCGCGADLGSCGRPRSLFHFFFFSLSFFFLSHYLSLSLSLARSLALPLRDTRWPTSRSGHLTCRSELCLPMLDENEYQDLHACKCDVGSESLGSCARKSNGLLKGLVPESRPRHRPARYSHVHIDMCACMQNYSYVHV